MFLIRIRSTTGSEPPNNCLQGEETHIIYESPIKPYFFPSLDEEWCWSERGGYFRRDHEKGSRVHAPSVQAAVELDSCLLDIMEYFWEFIRASPIFTHFITHISKIWIKSLKIYRQCHTHFEFYPFSHPNLRSPRPKPIFWIPFFSLIDCKFDNWHSCTAHPVVHRHRVAEAKENIQSIKSRKISTKNLSTVLPISEEAFLQIWFPKASNVKVERWVLLELRRSFNGVLELHWSSGALTVHG